MCLCWPTESASGARGSEGCLHLGTLGPFFYLGETIEQGHKVLAESMWGILGEGIAHGICGESRLPES